jgi:hypothetical protein
MLMGARKVQNLPPTRLFNVPSKTEKRKIGVAFVAGVAVIRHFFTNNQAIRLLVDPLAVHSFYLCNHSLSSFTTLYY